MIKYGYKGKSLKGYIDKICSLNLLTEKIIKYKIKVETKIGMRTYA